MNPERDQPPIVLVVEDDPDVRDFAEFIIADDLSFRTLAAATAKEATLFLKEAILFLKEPSLSM